MTKTPDRNSYTEFNSKTIDGWVESGWEWAIPISHEDFVKAKNGEWSVLLTPLIPVPTSWFLPFHGARLLGLASAGGQQMPIFTALGAVCTVLDYSQKQLDSEAMVAEREGYSIEIVKADMTKPLPFGDESFDMIFHPVSNCYIEDVRPVWRECFRVLKKDGVLLTGFDNGMNYLVEEEVDPLVIVNKLPFNPLLIPESESVKRMIAGDNGIQFGHTLDDQIGGQLEAGFVITGFYEDKNSDGALRDYCSQFIATRAVKPVA